MIWWCELAGTNLRFGYCWMAEVKSPHSIALTNWSAAPWPIITYKVKALKCSQDFWQVELKVHRKHPHLLLCLLVFACLGLLHEILPQYCWWYWDVGDPAKFLRPWVQQANVSRWLEGKKPVILWKNGGSVSKKSGTLVSKKDRPAVLLQVKP